MMQVLAPSCPTCNAICGHPLRMAVSCRSCGGTGEDKLHGEYDAVGPLNCAFCNGAGKVLPSPPTDEQVARAENRWVCLGGGSLHHDFGAAREGRSCHRCGVDYITWYAAPSDCGDCPGHDDVVADEALWAAVKRAWRQRSKQVDLTSTATKMSMVIDRRFLPDIEDENRSGHFRVLVTFEPED